MTLTSLLPTLRESLPSPLARDLWPALTRPGVDDVVIAGVSLRRYVEICGTPCVESGPAIIPLSGGCLSPTETTTVLVTSVTRVVGDGAERVLVVDSVLDDVEAHWGELRLIARVSHAYDRRFAVRDARGSVVHASVVAQLPADLEVGDLLAVPCRGTVTVGRVRPRV